MEIVKFLLIYLLSVVQFKIDLIVWKLAEKAMNEFGMDMFKIELILWKFIRD